MPRLVASDVSEVEFNELTSPTQRVVTTTKKTDIAVDCEAKGGGSLSQLFTYSTWQDRVLLCVGLCTAVISGANQVPLC